MIPSTSSIQLSRSALEHNLNFIRGMLHNHTQLSSVVKGNAYGHQLEVFAPLAQSLGQNHFSVFSADEAFRLYKVLKPESCIHIMGYMDQDAMEWAMEKKIGINISSIEQLEQCIQLIKTKKLLPDIHLELETGMHRTGLNKNDFQHAQESLAKVGVPIQGICSHLAGAESITNFKRIKDQIKRFKKFSSRAEHIPMKHLACSAALLRYPKTQLDRVRVGILQYGFFPNHETLVHYLIQNKTEENPLKRVLSWTSKVMEIKQVKAGEFIGYGSSFLTNKDMSIAIVPVGYSHGFARSLSNQGKVLIGGQRLDVVGNVNMNMMAVNVSALPAVEVGDEVVLIGRQGEAEISVASFSEYTNLVNYELLTRLPQDIPRIIVP